MPLRKAKGRRRPKVTTTAHTAQTTQHEEVSTCIKQQETQDAAANEVDSVAETLQSSMDEEERKARNIIAVLAKKYQVRDDNRGMTKSLDIIQVDAVEEEKEEERGEATFGKENTALQDLPQSTQKYQLVPHRAALKKPSRGKSPQFKVPKPIHLHSTPATATHRTDTNSLFGFEELDSPLGLSPVSVIPTHPSHHSSLLAAEGSGLVKSSPYSRLRGTYDIPFKKKTPKKQVRRKKKKSFSASDRWAQNLNAEFTTVEHFKLAVD